MKSAIVIMLLLVAVLATPAICGDKPPFKDVPKDHWASEYVAAVAEKGIMKGYPDATFKGERAVTRYELAVALERMIEVVQNSLKPEMNKQPQASPAPQSAQPKVENANPKPEAQSSDPAQRLKEGGYIAANSPLLTDRQKTVSSAELAQALSSVAAKMIEKNIPVPKDQR